jgi:4-hydroxy-2-oxoheptanedioate aldolase
MKKLWSEDRIAINIFLGLPDSFAAEIIASQGWDGVTIDMQHGVIDYQVGVTMLQAISIYEATPLVRVPWNDPAIIMKVLDAGAYGVICPMINNREEAERFVGACRYAPEGYRSTGPVRAAFYAGADYHQHAADTILTFAMIETQTGVNNVDEIFTTPGLDAVYIGPSDLSTSLGGAPGGDQRTPEVMAAIETILAAAKRHNIRAAIHALTSDYANEMIEKGFDLVTLSAEYRHMATQAAQVLSEVKSKN